MSESIRSRTFWKLILATFALWTLFGIITALQYYADISPTQRLAFPISRWMFLTLRDNWLKAALTVPLILALMTLHSRVKRWLPRLACYLLLFFGFMSLHIVVRPLVAPFLIYEQGQISHKTYTYREQVVIAVESFLLSDVMGFLIVVLIFNSWRYAEEMHMRALNEERLRARLAQAELQALKMQLHPHFLFNTLNAIYNLAPQNSGKAQRMISRLSNLLRLSLDHVSSNMVSLQQELEFLDCYVDIEKTRFEERLKVVQEIDSEALDASVPNLFLQPLVENAIRHGIAKKASGGTVSVRAAKLADRLTITITDDGRLAKPAGNAKGIGLANTRARLAQLFGEDYVFKVQPTSEGTRVLIDMPYIAIKPGPEEKLCDESHQGFDS